MSSPRLLGSLIGAVFGLVYLLVNAGALPSDAALPVRLVGVIAFLLVLVAVVRSGARAGAGAASGRPVRGFGPGYWPIVAGEVVALAGGLRVINGPLDTPKAAVAWVSFVVGAHFLALAVAFGERLFLWLGCAIGACGVVGLAIAALDGSSGLIAATSGVIPGALLLASAWWGTHATPALELHAE